MSLNSIFNQTYKWEYEKGISDNQNDKGGKTNDGITYKHYTAYCQQVLGRSPSYEHFLSMSKDDVMKFYNRVWLRMGCDKIQNIILAGVCFDFGFNSEFAKREIQEVLQGLGYKIVADNIFGNQTITALNDAFNKYQYGLIDLILSARIAYVSSLVYKEISQLEFLKGWLNRIISWREYALNNA